MAFVGRTRALSRLRGAVEEAAAGRARLVLVAGEAGIGKTTLVSEAAARSGWAVGWGTCADAERAPAFWAWSTALRGLLQAAGPTVTEGLSDVEELARLLPELSGQAGAEPSVVDTEAARLRLFDAIARLLERIAGHAPAFVVLDDLQWADASTLALLRFVVRPYRPVPLVIVGVYRPDELTESVAETFVELAARADEDLAAARDDHDLGRAERLDTERAALLAELRRAAGLGGRDRALGTSTSERARKAVTARVRDAIHRIGAVLPDLGAHLDRSVLTGNTCRYAPTEPVRWTLRPQAAERHESAVWAADP